MSACLRVALVHSRLAFALAVAFALLPGRGEAFDASGVWIGRRTCTGFGSDQGKIVTKHLDSTLSISQSGRHARLAIDGVGSFNAIVIENPGRPEDGYFGVVACGTKHSFVPSGANEVGKLEITTKRNGRATIKGTTIESRASSEDAVLTCTWSYKRFYASFPPIEPCEGDGNPTPTPSPTPASCPVGLEIVPNAGSSKVLDQGWTGLGHGATIPSGGKLTVAVDCDGDTRPCGVCDVSGPIPNVDADDGGISSRRCSNDTSIKCTAGATCGAGECVFFLGPPLSLSAGGISTCVTNQVNGAVSGTANVESGAFAWSIDLTARVYNQFSVDQPCPRCQGDSVPNDGDPGGVCNGGARDGKSCDANGASPVFSFGAASLDCPPQGLISALPIPLHGSTGTESVALSAASPDCSGFGLYGDKCFCPFAGTEPTRPNACLDDDSGTPFCAPITGTSKGQCEDGPLDRVCSPLETFRSCVATANCNGNDTCVVAHRPCFPDNGQLGGSVQAIGAADPPTEGVANPTFASLFCVPPVTQPAINAASGFPGLGRLELPLITRELLTLPSSE